MLASRPRTSASRRLLKTKPSPAEDQRTLRQTANGRPAALRGSLRRAPHCTSPHASSQRRLATMAACLFAGRMSSACVGNFSQANRSRSTTAAVCGPQHSPLLSPSALCAHSAAIQMRPLKRIVWIMSAETSIDSVALSSCRKASVRVAKGQLSDLRFYNRLCPTRQPP